MIRQPARTVVALLALTVVALLAARGDSGAASVPAPKGYGGAVAAGDAYATAAGLDMLAAGGNAVDAAVATALVLAVTFPEAGNLGGGGFAVVWLPGHEGAAEELTTLDFRERAPAAAHRDMYLGPDGEPVREASLIGPLAAGVPARPSACGSCTAASVICRGSRWSRRRRSWRATASWSARICTAS